MGHTRVCGLGERRKMDIQAERVGMGQAENDL